MLCARLLQSSHAARVSSLVQANRLVAPKTNIGRVALLQHNNNNPISSTFSTTQVSR